MRFTYCKYLLTKKSFCLFSIEYFYADEFNNILLRSFGLSKFFEFFCFMLFEFHSAGLYLNKSFYNFGFKKIKNFALLCLKYVQPHVNLQYFYFLNVIKYVIPTNNRGINLFFSLPLRSQRTHSNSKNIHRFRNNLLNNILYIPGINLKSSHNFLKDTQKELADEENDLIKKPKKQPKNQKKKEKPKKKRKKLDVWR